MRATVKKVIQETARVKTIVVEPEQPVSFKTGQCMRLSTVDEKKGRLFSMANPGGDNITELVFTLLVFPDGVFSSHVPRMKPGDVIDVAGPFGKFIFDENDTRDIVLIAGGSGISVLRSILLHVLEKKLPNKIHLLFSVLNKDEIIYKQELEGLDRQYMNFTYTVTVTNDHDNWDGMCGLITKEMFDSLFGDYSQVFYICGPSAFNDCAEQILNEKGVSDDRIRIDRWKFYTKEQKGDK